jgi:hypothetical protein
LQFDSWSFTQFWVLYRKIVGWGLDEEYIEPEDMDYEAVKPVKRVVTTPRNTVDEQEDRKTFLCGVCKVSDLDDLMEE